MSEGKLLSPCPRCGNLVGAPKTLEELEGPKPGDVAMCMSCAAALVVNDDLSLRPCTREDLLDLIDYDDTVPVEAIRILRKHEL